MLCRKPFVSGGVAFGCGQCMPCRVNRRRIWTHRIMLESAEHGDKTFVTLTYDDDHLPKLESGIATLVSKDLQDFLKRLRFAVAPKQLRFFACGEYGEDKKFQGGVEILGRPHYHLALFGYPNCLRGVTNGGMFFTKDQEFRCCSFCDMLYKSWGKGLIQLGGLTKDSAHYIGGYVTKKLVKGDVNLHGRVPEFARMSNRPGIGAASVARIAEAIRLHGLDEKMVDVPVALAHGGKAMPLGRYLRRKLRVELGRGEEVPREVMAQLQAEMLPLLLDSIADAESSFAKEIVKAGDGKYAAMVSRSRIYKERKSL